MEQVLEMVLCMQATVQWQLQEDLGAAVLLGKGWGSLKLYLPSNILVSYWFYLPGKVSWMT